MSMCTYAVSLVSVGLDEAPRNIKKHVILLMALQVRLLVLAKNVAFGGTGLECYRECPLAMSMTVTVPKETKSF